MKLRDTLKKIVYGHKATSERYIAHLRSLGVKIGEECTVYAPTKTQIDLTRPWLIDIGGNVKITEGVTILTHGFDWSVLKGAYGDVLGSSGRVSIGDNVFIGMHSTILKGVRIGSNVIIGANSLVNRDIPDNCVAAGNPCKVMMSLEAYREKRRAAQTEEARELVALYRERYGKEPDETVLREFFWLFTDGADALPECWESVMKLGGSYELSKQAHQKNVKQFADMDDFLNRI